MQSNLDPERVFAPPGSAPDFSAQRAGSLALLTPLHAEAAEWLKAEVSSDASWFEGSLAVERRYLSPIVDAIFEAGFRFAR